jgi:diguanylate cyclase (GGDEF)-like protein
MIYIYFFYGLSFFTLGISIIFYPKKGSEFRIAKTLVFMALFGIFHGIQEWAEMFGLLHNPAESIVLKISCLVLLPLSYYFLATFGIKSILRDDASLLAIQSIPVGLFVLWFILTASASQHSLMGSIWARYLLALPATVLTGCALLKQSAAASQMKPHISRNFSTAAFIFFLYGILTGLVVPDARFFPASIINYAFVAGTTGIPVQVFRMVCAIIITYNMTSILSVFAWETQERLRSLSLKDELTGLLNRRGFFALAEQQIAIAKRQNRRILLNVGDMDNLKQINDTLGHAEGDTAIVEIAAILRDSFRQSDVIARIGGDEFAVLQAEAAVGDMTESMHRLQNNIDICNDRGKRPYRLSLSVGSSFSDLGEACSIHELVRQADEIMYERKKIKKIQTLREAK